MSPDRRPAPSPTRAAEQQPTRPPRRRTAGAAASRRAPAPSAAGGIDHRRATSTPTTARPTRSRTSTIDYAANEVTAMIGPSGCGKSTLLRCLNRMHEEIPGARADGHGPARRHRHLRRRHRRRRRAARDRHGLPEAEPVPDDVDLRQRRRRPEARRASRASDMDERGREVAARRRPVGGGQGPPERARRSACRAASSSACASRARSRSSPRCILMDEPCSALDPIATLKIEELIARAQARLHDRHRHPQHAAGRARGRHARRSSGSAS